MRALLIVLLLFLAGCATPVEPATIPEETEPIQPEYKPNLWLLDGPRPVSSAQISGGAEPSILTDQDGKFIWIADTDGGYYSENNGTSWSELPYFLPPSVVSDGWALAQDGEGAFYAMALTGPELELAMSSDGRTWDYVYPAAQVAAVTDRPWLAARGDGELAVIYYDYPLGESCARSTDGGLTWIDVNRALNSGAPQGGSLSYNADGDLMYVDDDGRIYTYEDGLCQPGPDSKNMNSQLGANNMIQLDTHPDGSFFIAAATNQNLDVELYGERAGTVKRLVVSDDSLKSNTFVSVSTYEDLVAVGWYGSETAGNPSVPTFNGAFNVYLAVVKDFWGTPQVETWRITDEPNHVGDICMGGIGCGGDADRDLLDYWMLDFDIWGGVHLAYGHDGTTSNAVVRYAQVSAAQIKERFGPEEEPKPEAPPLPRARFSASTQDLTVTVDGTNSKGEGLSYSWDFGDGATAAGGSPSHTYASDGTYTISLEIKDKFAQVDTATRSVSVQEGRTNQAPTAKFSYRFDAGAPVQFTDESSDDGSISRWSWDFGDGTTSSLQSPAHQYDPGTYEVTLVVEDNEGATASASAEVAIPEPTVDPGPGPVESEPTPAPFVLLGLFLLACARLRR